MKKITKFLLAITMIFALSFTNAQSFSVEGYIVSSPQLAHPVILTYEYDSFTVITDTIFTNTTDGYFMDSFNTTLSLGELNMTYTDCLGYDSTIIGVYTTFLGPRDYGTILYCPSSYTYDADFSVQFVDFTSAVNFELSWDNGVTFTSHISDAAGYFTDTLIGAPNSGTVIIRYTDCNNVLRTENSSFSYPYPSNYLILDICDPITTHISVINNDGASIALNLSYDGGLTYTTVYTDTFGIYIDTISPSGSLIVTFTNCNGDLITDTVYSLIFDILILDLDYCPVVCEAYFYISQEVIFDTITLDVVFTGNMMITDMSIGTSLTYTWDFGDGSPIYSGVNFTHTYSAGSYNLCLTIDNGSGCSHTYCDSLVIDSNGILNGKTNAAFVLQMGAGEFETEGPNAINELENNVEVNIYPNPATSVVNISLNSKINENATLAIYDLTGKLVQLNNIEIVKGNQVVKIELNELNKGMYITQLKTVNGTLSTKLSIK